MNTSRRNFLKKAAVTAPGLSLIGTAYGIPETGVLHSPDILNADPQLDDGWINVRDCGASGSTFETTAATKISSKQITVANAGDFKAGQGVMVSKCNIRYEKIQMWGTGLPYYNMKPVENSVEVRGYDGSAGSWVIYIIDIAPSASPVFRWTEDLGRTWHPEVHVTHGWQPLSGGVEVRLNQRDWESGYVIAFGARDQLISRIEKIEGNVLTLTDEANRTVNDAVVRHNDTFAIQTAIDKALMEKLRVYVPVGNYRLAHSIRVGKASTTATRSDNAVDKLLDISDRTKNNTEILIEGASAVDTVFDISDGEGSCFDLIGGKEVTIRNFRMVGFMGFDERDKAGYINTRGSTYIWGFGLKHCNAVNIRDTERVLVENCHASRMSGECFVASGHSRGTAKPGESYTQWITYRRCSVTDSARNAFNDVMSSIENTSVLNCRIVDVGGCTWEGASRFVKFIGNYVRNAGTVAIGNLGPPNREADELNPRNRDKMYPELGAGQHIIADNVFESIIPYGGCAIRTSSGATQVIIRNNLFINFDSSAIEALGNTDATHYASANTTITGNIFDMTCIGQKPLSRTAILVSANDTIVSDNQIYVRGTTDQLVTGIRLREPALNMNVHDNLIRNCGSGIITERGRSVVGEVIDNNTFLRSNSPSGLPQDRIRPETVKGWSILWRSSDEKQPLTGISVIESFEPDTLRFSLREPRKMKAGDSFDVIAPSLNWIMHDNTITDCLRPVVLDSYGSKTSIFRDNQVTRGNTSNVSLGVEVHGCFQLLDNHLTDFDEGNAIALKLYPDDVGHSAKSQYQGNIFEN